MHLASHRHNKKTARITISVTTIEKPKPLKCIPIALVLFVDFNLSITTEDPTTSAIAAPNPATNLAIIQMELFSVIPKTKEETTHTNRPNLKYLTLECISLIKIEKIDPAK